jgi:hypothetical protein
VEELEHEADSCAAQTREIVLAQRGDVGALDQNVPRGGRIQPVDQPEQRRLAAAGRADDGEKLPPGNAQRQRLEDGERMGTARDGLGDVAELNHSGFTIGRKALQTVSATRSAPAAVG